MRRALLRKPCDDLVVPCNQVAQEGQEVWHIRSTVGEVGCRDHGMTLTCVALLLLWPAASPGHCKRLQAGPFQEAKVLA